PRNVDALKIQHVLLYFVRSGGATFEIPTADLRFLERGAAGLVGGEAGTVEGVISTRRGNDGSWSAITGKAPVGEWELKLPMTEVIRNRFEDGEIEDILFVITTPGEHQSG
ncbi:MAG: hypothetical protein WKF37_03000, partial [Bryobacteraceae bacterium]